MLGVKILNHSIDRACTCPSQTVPRDSSHVLVKNLGPALEHSPSISGDYKDAFIAHPLPARKPRDRSVHVPQNLVLLGRESATLPPEREPENPPEDIDAAKARTITSPELGLVAAPEILMESDNESEASLVMGPIHQVRSPRENTIVEQNRHDESCQNDGRSFRKCLGVVTFTTPLSNNTLY